MCGFQAHQVEPLRAKLLQVLLRAQQAVACWKRAFSPAVAGPTSTAVLLVRTSLKEEPWVLVIECCCILVPNSQVVSKLVVVMQQSVHWLAKQRHSKDNLLWSGGLNDHTRRKLPSVPDGTLSAHSEPVDQSRTGECFRYL